MNGYYSDPTAQGESLKSLKKLLEQSLAAQKNLQYQQRQQIILVRKIIGYISQVTSGQAQDFDVSMLRLVNELHSANNLDELSRSANRIAKFASEPENRLSVRLRETRSLLRKNIQKYSNHNHVPELQKRVYEFVERIERPMTLQQLLDLLTSELLALVELAAERAPEQNPKQVFIPKGSGLSFEESLEKVTQHLKKILHELVDHCDMSLALIEEETRDTKDALLKKLGDEQDLFNIMNLLMPCVNLHHVALRVLSEHLAENLNLLRAELVGSDNIFDHIKLGLEDIDNIAVTEKSAHVMQMRVSSKVVDMLELLKAQGNQAARLTEKALQNAGQIQEHIKDTEDLLPKPATEALINRKQFSLELNRLVAISHRSQSALSVAICSIDNIDEICSRYGSKLVGKLLTMLAKALASQLRDGDTISNYGGGRFSLILPGTIIQGVPTVLARLHNYMVRIPVRYRGEQIDVRLSFGGATLRNKEKSTWLMERAAKAQDYAQESGGRQVSMSHSGDIFTKCILDNNRFCLSQMADDLQADTSDGLFCGAMGPCSYNPKLPAPEIH